MQGVDGIYPNDLIPCYILYQLWKGYPEFQDIPLGICKITPDCPGLKEINNLRIINDF